jgi:UDP-N-acetylglucosamine 4,6-dehydratase
MGRLVIQRLVTYGHSVTCFSRDEQKQRIFKGHKNIDCVLGDIRDFNRVSEVMNNNFHAVCHLAALKCVDSVQENPYESVLTNVIGLKNVIRACENWNYPNLIYTSSDKACYPINVYGQCKAIGESLMRQYKGPSVTFRYGNILGSRGSVLYAFVKKLLTYKVVDITDEKMTRFWVDADDVADLLTQQLIENRSTQKTLVKVSKTLKVTDVAACVAAELGIKSYETINIGIGLGEKLHETLCTQHDIFDGERGPEIESCYHEQYTLAEFREIIRPLVLTIKKEIQK